MRGTRAASLAFDDQVGAILRDLGSGTTGDVRRGFPDKVPQTWQRRCTCHCGQIEHRITEHYMGRVDSSEVRASLRRLARRGLVVEIPTPTPNNGGGHLWLWTG